MRCRLVLLTSELATNAVIHAGPYNLGEDMAVDVECSAGVVRVAVTDCGGGTVLRRDGAPDGLSGRGLLLVDALADSWGVTENGSARVVWFEVSVEPAPGAAKPIWASPMP